MNKRIIIIILFITIVYVVGCAKIEQNEKNNQKAYVVHNTTRDTVLVLNNPENYSLCTIFTGNTLQIKEKKTDKLVWVGSSDLFSIIIK